MSAVEQTNEDAAKKEDGSVRHWISLWCQTVMLLLLKSMGDDGKTC